MRLSARIEVLESEMRQLIKLWERFFAGDIRIPPSQEKDRLGRRLRALAEGRPLRAGESFRLTQLQHRFMSYATNWERMLREREEGVRRWVPGGRERVQPDRAGAAAATANAGAAATVDIDGRPSLFDSWRRAKEGLGHKVAIDRAAFERQIERQRQALEHKTGHPVEFEVKVDDGRVKLAVRRASGGTGEE
jgi:hypothetical protein